MRQFDPASSARRLPASPAFPGGSRLFGSLPPFPRKDDSTTRGSEGELSHFDQQKGLCVGFEWIGSPPSSNHHPQPHIAACAPRLPSAPSAASAPRPSSAPRPWRSSSAAPHRQALQRCCAPRGRKFTTCPPSMDAQHDSSGDLNAHTTVGCGLEQVWRFWRPDPPVLKVMT